MKNKLLAILFKLSYNNSLRKLAKKIFIYFPKLKGKIKRLLNSGTISSPNNNLAYKDDFILAIKEEIEQKRGI